MAEVCREPSGVRIKTGVLREVAIVMGRSGCFDGEKEGVECDCEIGS